MLEFGFRRGEEWGFAKPEGLLCIFFYYFFIVAHLGFLRCFAYLVPMILTCFKKKWNYFFDNGYISFSI